MTGFTPTVSATPFQKIALSCSGGGYRAATFHLGTMAYLHHLRYHGKPLLDNVRLISTVSGGTITGAIYALKKQEGASFEEFYAFLLHRIQHIDLVEKGLKALNPGAKLKNESKRKNLINAFAEIYDDHFTGGATFSSLDQMKSHLEAVVFNSTEFNNGINFRFRNRGTGHFGNNSIRVPQQAAGEVKVADAIASSSCFPGGFEPLMWPDDFVHDDAPGLRRLKDDRQKDNVPAVGIMDGGIYDNQGIDSILIYDRNKRAEAGDPYFDLVIISDVASPYMKAFTFAKENPAGKGLDISLKQAWQRVTTTLVVLMVFFAALPLLWKYQNHIFTGISLALSGIFLLLWAGLMMAVRRIKALPGKFLSDFYTGRLAHLKLEQISLRWLVILLVDRGKSLITLLSDVFLKVVRRLNYYKLYDDDQYQYRRITTLIKELTEEDYAQKNKSEKRPAGSLLKGSFGEVVSPAMAAVSKMASEVGTTLWFTPEQHLDEILDKLIAAGEFTMCYNMIEYLEDLIFTPGNGFEALPETTRDRLQELYVQCESDWRRFNEDPLFLVRAMKVKT